MNTNTIQTLVHKRAGLTAAILGTFFGIISIFFMGIIFVPLAFFCTGFAFYQSIRHNYKPAIGLSVLALLIAIIGLLTSPALLLTLGIGMDFAFLSSSR